MTYNFDPEAWYDRELDALEARRAAGELADEDYQAELDRLAERYQELVDRAAMPCDYRGSD